jgi:hypothetical protein
LEKGFREKWVVKGREKGIKNPKHGEETREKQSARAGIFWAAWILGQIKSQGVRWLLDPLKEIKVLIEGRERRERRERRESDSSLTGGSGDKRRHSRDRGGFLSGVWSKGGARFEVQPR